MTEEEYYQSDAYKRSFECAFDNLKLRIDDTKQQMMNAIETDIVWLTRILKWIARKILK